jgi:hypothetical protein
MTPFSTHAGTARRRAYTSIIDIKFEPPPLFIAGPELFDAPVVSLSVTLNRIVRFRRAV